MADNISWVRAANLKDEREAELLRRELSDLMHRQGWNYKLLCEQFNRFKDSENKKPVHFNNIKAALKGLKKHRSLAFDIEQFMISNEGPLKDVVVAINAN